LCVCVDAKVVKLFKSSLLLVYFLVCHQQDQF
jgi:hypothetical protein